mmetsp:Transcript_155958/g.500019  ORF Transcript_155958/g.500019 Transcript_155958/m.500019 type:complete len:409 (-) Transcript_155958:43-1269(-)
MGAEGSICHKEVGSDHEVSDGKKKKKKDKKEKKQKKSKKDRSDSSDSEDPWAQHRTSVEVSGGVQLNSLLEAFELCDPERSGYVRDHSRFAEVAMRLTGLRDSADSFWRQLDRDGNGAVSFPEFVEWAQMNRVALPIGLTGGTGDVGPGGVAFPSTWQGPRDPRVAVGWNQRTMVTDGKLFAELQQMLDLTYKKVWTRDRKATGNNQVPDGYQLVRAMHSENFSDWNRYYLKRHRLVQDCANGGWLQQYQPLTAQASGICARHTLRAEACNEWLLFHGTNSHAAEAICRGDFTMHLSGSATGTLYGKGTYFAESITKADEYAKADAEDNCCALVCRVAGGQVLYNDEVEPSGEAMQDMVLKDGLYHSIIGDREKCRGTFKEYVVFDADQVYVEYILVYKRKYAAVPTS